jgi:hypothetical protein
VLESLACLPVSEREAILASLSESEAEQLQYDWSFYARPNQLLPAGNWWPLADRSCKLSPAGWARQAVDAYHEFKAPSVILAARLSSM